MSYKVKVVQRNKVLKTSMVEDVATTFSIYVPSVVWKAVLVHGATVHFNTLKLTRELEE